MNKYYAVFSLDSREDDIFTDWKDALVFIQSRRAIYKKVHSLLEAQAWIETQQKLRIRSPQFYHYLAFVDGSVKQDIPSWGLAIYQLNTKYGPLSHVCTHEDFGKCSKWPEFRNETGELTAAVHAVIWARKNNCPIVIIHDYEGVAAYPTDTWEPQSELAKNYTDFIKAHSHLINGFHWIKGHQKGDSLIITGNNHADRLAAKAFET